MIFIQITEQLNSLSNLLVLLTDSQYNQRIKSLGHVSIGSHTRHIIELVKCATNGYSTRVVDYLNRVRDLAIETDKEVARNELAIVAKKIVMPDKKINLVVEGGDEFLTDKVSSTYFREIVYNTEHTIHHLALIRVALREMELELVGGDFGMAYSTVRYLASRNKDQN